MKILKEVYDSPWDFTLYKTDEIFVLNIDFCNSFVDVTRSFKLKEDEINYTFEEIKQLAERIRKDYESYKHREITPVVTM
ncbi:MAG: hypothetical protein HRT66_08620 [Flavobacteriaceae bacterium]|nr:hypothetical protein [Flavobacteriaceae bacterium]